MINTASDVHRLWLFSWLEVGQTNFPWVIDPGLGEQYCRRVTMRCLAASVAARLTGQFILVQWVIAWFFVRGECRCSKEPIHLNSLPKGVVWDCYIFKAR